MKRYFKSVAFCASVLLIFVSCSSISRVDAETQTDLSGYWNDTDVRIVCDSLIKACLDSPRVTQETTKLGRIPVVLVGNFKNDSDEHIDTSIISRTMEIAIFNSGKADFVAGGDTRGELRAERQDQQGNASEAYRFGFGERNRRGFSSYRYGKDHC